MITVYVFIFLAGYIAGTMIPIGIASAILVRRAIKGEAPVRRAGRPRKDGPQHRMDGI